MQTGRGSLQGGKTSLGGGLGRTIQALLGSLIRYSVSWWGASLLQCLLQTSCITLQAAKVSYRVLKLLLQVMYLEMKGLSSSLCLGVTQRGGARPLDCDRL